MRAATSSESSLSFWRWSFLVEGEGAPPLPLLLALVLPPGEGGVLVEEKEEVERGLRSGLGEDAAAVVAAVPDAAEKETLGEDDAGPTSKEE